MTTTLKAGDRVVLCGGLPLEPGGPGTITRVLPGALSSGTRLVRVRWDVTQRENGVGDDIDECAVWDCELAPCAAPGAQTADERLAQAIAERDAAVAARDALAVAVRGLFAAQAAASMPVEAHDLPALLLNFVAGVPADEGIVAAGRALVDARTALDAALAAAGGAR